jgi:hypothetical protein
MSRVALTAAWTVTAGVIPGRLEPEHTKQWLYTSEHREEDEANANDGKDTNNFTRMMKEAHDYACQITNPAYLNWVKVEFLWL